eukprot:2316222-Pleurochrysis_carterae.AAC.1
MGVTQGIRCICRSVQAMLGRQIGSWATGLHEESGFNEEKLSVLRELKRGERERKEADNGLELRASQETQFRSRISRWEKTRANARTRAIGGVRGERAKERETEREQEGEGEGEGERVCVREKRRQETNRARERHSSIIINRPSSQPASTLLR